MEGLTRRRLVFTEVGFAYDVFTLCRSEDAKRADVDKWVSERWNHVAAWITDGGYGMAVKRAVSNFDAEFYRKGFKHG